MGLSPSQELRATIGQVEGLERNNQRLRERVEELEGALEEIQSLDDTPEPERVLGVFSREQARTITGLREYIYDMKRRAREALKDTDA